jgi:putative ABC transport system ATP-binding protein
VRRADRRTRLQDRHEALLAINNQLGTTTLVITHNASIQDVADRVLFFADGRISKIHKNEARKAAGELVW